MVEQNPFNETFDADHDRALIERATAGSRNALNELLRRHHNFVYNIALKMLGSVPDAKDATQDILIKLLTHLAKYDPARAQFRTWLYRIAFNHLLNVKRSAPEQIIRSFPQFFEFVGDVPDDLSLMDEPDFGILTNEMKFKCLSGMLMCVPREDRLLYIVGDLFRVNHRLGAELFELTPANFRKKLSRIRQQLRQWMHNRCGLVNPDNPCRCAKKTRGFIERGIVDPKNLVWDKEGVQSTHSGLFRGEPGTRPAHVGSHGGAASRGLPLQGRSPRRRTTR